MSAGETLRKAQLVRTNLEKLARIPQASCEEFAAGFRNLLLAIELC